MSDEQKDIHLIFLEAVEKSTTKERAAYLNDVCQDNVELRADLESLLKAHEKSGGFLETPAFESEITLDSSPISEVPGTTIGRYKLLEKIGEGGMAVVYMAEQREPIRRKVAFKIIKLGMDTRQVIARFEAERQALAMMDHPNIAKVFDAGATETGRPYFVMELVHGVSITDYCDKNKLDTRRRLELLVQVCHAVQHAHQKGIIHRDIKPSNVLVTMHDDEPVPKVIDFGIAKATNQRLTEKTVFTRYAHFIGTPAYMSPEQAQMSGLDVDTRSDIYSLGVLLYELLTGTTPFDAEVLRKAGYTEIQRIICETDPLKPSTKLSKSGQTLTDLAQQRKANPDTLHKLVKGDLDWIVMKCLEKDLTRRYETTHELAGDIERHLRNEPILAGSPSLIYRAQKFWRRHRQHIITAAVITILFAGLISAIWMYQRSVNARKIQWAQSEAIPDIINLIEQQDYSAAFSLAKRAKEHIPNDPTLNELWSRICKDYSITTNPTGASIFYREHSATDTPWEYLGLSPLKNIILPQDVYQWKIEKEGFDTHECVTDNSFDVSLQEEDFPGEMVWIDAWTVEIHRALYTESTMVYVPAYLIDKYEVTNEQFKEFVNQGGYENRDYWRESKFLKEGQKISWEQAISEFVDKTGLSGPATWEGGTYPEGQGKHPVSGVSWFEADAYAKFISKNLPTVYHWERAACLHESMVIIPYSNFAQGGSAPVGKYPGMGQTGLYDMAGNVKEWCFNAIDNTSSRCYILGGGWNEPTYMFTAKDSQSPWDRSELNGFRCVHYKQTEEPLANEFLKPLRQDTPRDFSKLVPFTNEEFEALKAQYKYDQTNLNVHVEDVNKSALFWIKERITFDAAYGRERVIVHMYLPKAVAPPYQAVVYFPSGGAVYENSFKGLPPRHFIEHIIRTGRALVYPIYKGTYERPAAIGRVWSMSSVVQTPLAYRDWTIKMAKDLGRCIDYLETRSDIDNNKIGYCGLSWGALLGPIMLAVEDRLKTGVFVVGGLGSIELPRYFDTALYAQRVTVPVLMINGREDFLLPLETSQIPMYELLGTPDEDKEHKIYPGGHAVFSSFHSQIEKDLVAWLNIYLGPVNGQNNNTKSSEL
jgi:serine/threonine protein kinase/dienelactone hydrolase